MKKTILGLMLSCSVVLQAQHDNSTLGIEFEHGTWQQALAKAQKEKKLIMLDAYASWCGPCKWMVKNIFPQQEVGAYYNANFVSIKLDMEKDSAGVRLAQKYGVSAYPTFIFIEPSSGNMVHQICGSRDAKEFIDAGKTAKNDEQNMSALRSAYLEDTRNPDNAVKYFEAAEDACVKIDADVTKYMEGLKPEQYLEKGNFRLIEKFVSDYSHSSIAYVMSNYEKFAEKFGKKVIDAKIQGLYKASLTAAAKKSDEKKFKEVQAAYRSQKNAPVEWLDAYSDVAWANSKGDTAAYFAATVKFIDKFYWSDAGKLNSAAWEFYEKTNNPENLKKAAGWAKHSMELVATYAAYDTYAALLYKLGKYADARVAATRAIDFGKDKKEDVTETESLLKKIEEKLKK